MPSESTATFASCSSCPGPTAMPSLATCTFVQVTPSSSLIATYGWPHQPRGRYTVPSGPTAPWPTAPPQCPLTPWDPPSCVGSSTNGGGPVRTNVVPPSIDFEHAVKVPNANSSPPSIEQ